MCIINLSMAQTILQFLRTTLRGKSDQPCTHWLTTIPALCRYTISHWFPIMET